MNDKKENEILLNLLEVATSADIKIEEINTDEWNDLIEKAKRLRVASMLYYRIGKSEIVNKIPKDILMSMRKTYLNSLSINMRLQKQLLSILNKMQSEVMSIIILKGFALGETIYNNIAIRPMGDIDLLVKAEYFEKFDRIMSDSGWENESYLNRLGSSVKHSKHVGYSKNKLHIELHPKIYELPLIDPWERAKKIEIGGTEAFILGTEDFLMHLCLHLEYHGLDMSSNLLWYIDIVELVRVHWNDIDWVYVIDSARKNKVNDSLYKILSSINENFKCDVPIDVLSQIKSAKGLMTYLNPLISRMFGPRALPLRHKAYIAFRSVFPSKDYMIFFYSQKHPNLFYVYYFVHIGSGIKKFFSGLFHIFFSHKHKKQ